MTEEYKLIIFGVGFEISAGEVDKTKYEYWKNREITAEPDESNKLNLFDYDWTDLNDIYHDNGPAMMDNTKLEIKKNEEIILETYLGKKDLKNSKIKFKQHEIKIGSDYFFLGYSHEKGTFYDVEFHTKSFDINKLLISYEVIEGFSIITDIEYDGESIDKGDYSTHTKELSFNVIKNE